MESTFRTILAICKVGCYYFHPQKAQEAGQANHPHLTQETEAEEDQVTCLL